MRTVLAYGGEEEEAARYDASLLGSESAGRKKGIFMGLTMGTFMLVMFCSVRGGESGQEPLGRSLLSLFRVTSPVPCPSLPLQYGVGMRFGATLIQWNRRDHPECIINPNQDICFTGAKVMRCGVSFSLSASPAAAV